MPGSAARCAARWASGGRLSGAPRPLVLFPDRCEPRSGASGGEKSPRERPEDSYLVDSASSHMLVSKIKPCMSKYKQFVR
jgi:hypothetical protein